MAWTAYTVTESLPYWPIEPSLTQNLWLNFQLDLFRSMWAVLPAAFLWGASFPLALAAIASRGSDPGRLVGGVYAANTVGAIAGALGASLILVSWMGSQHVQQMLIVISAAAGLLMWAPVGARRPKFQAGDAVAIIVTIVCAIVLVWSVPPGFGRIHCLRPVLPARGGTAEVIYAREGRDRPVSCGDPGSGRDA